MEGVRGDEMFDEVCWGCEERRRDENRRREKLFMYLRVLSHPPSHQHIVVG